MRFERNQYHVVKELADLLDLMTDEKYDQTYVELDGPYPHFESAFFKGVFSVDDYKDLDTVDITVTVAKEAINRGLVEDNGFVEYVVTEKGRRWLKKWDKDNASDHTSAR